MSMSSYLLNLNEWQMDGLRHLSNVTGVSMAQHLRQAVDNYLGRAALPCALTVSGQALSGFLYVFRVGG